MGIPSYFSYIIRNHSNIIRNWKQLRQSESRGVFHSLYMDCNSIIYDAVNTSTETDKQLASREYEELLISRVIAKINDIVRTIQPVNTLYIAFDGVAPFAKMNQQRVRRYKNAYMAAIDFHLNDGIRFKENNGISGKWSTSSITPGTRFMEKLSDRLSAEYSKGGKSSNLGCRNIQLSASNEAGEGEHKMFQYMRNHTSSKGENIAVYGLDSDLIMLSVFHCLLCDNIWICRESPEFAKSVLPKNIPPPPPNELLFLDIRVFSNSILQEMQVKEAAGSKMANCRIYDYVFMCFLLGNDFLPHFPALNIRTDGTGRIMDAYAKYIASFPERTLISADTGKIQWQWVKVLLSELAEHEHTFITQEYGKREKLERGVQRMWTSNIKTPQEREEMFSNTPILFRNEEKYICPSENGWEARYYKSLFHATPSEEFVKDVCINYLEGLEWVFRYYTDKCPHWRWSYRFHYPPLLGDLIKYIPAVNVHSFINLNDKANVPFDASEQLAYVLPAEQHYLLPTKKLQELKENPEEYAKKYPLVHQLKFQWAFCRYFWECHLDM